MQTFMPDARAAEKRLFLEISDFRLESSERLAVFGRPVNLSTSEPVSGVIAKLQALISGERLKDANADDADVSSPLRSQAGDLDERPSHMATSVATQDLFSTQVDQGQGNILDYRPNAVPNAGLINSQVISNLLAGFNVGKAVKRDIAPENVPARHKQRSVLTPSSSEKISAGTLKLQAKANEQHLSLSAPSSSSLKSHGSQDLTDHLEQMNSSLNSGSEKENSQESWKSQLQVAQLHSNEGGNSQKSKNSRQADQLPSKEYESSQEHKNNQPQIAQLPSKEEGKTTSTTESNPPIIPVLFFDQFQRPDPFAGMKRIPRKYVRIQEAQLAMLERNDSWFEPSTDGRPRYANIPSSVHDDLIRFMDRVPGVQSSFTPHLNASVDESSSEREENDSESEDEHEHKVEIEAWHSHRSTEHRESTRPEILYKSQSIEAPSKDIDDAESEREENWDDDSPVPWTPSPQRISSPSHHTVTQDNGGHVANQDDSASGYNSNSPSAQPESNQALLGHLDTGIEKIKQRLDWRKMIAIPSSSPGAEEELELAVPYAIGDAIEDNTESDANLPSATPHVSSTAPQKGKLVEVERTPYQSLPQTKSNIGLLPRIQPRDAVLSDPFIPATFDDVDSHSITSSLRPSDLDGANASPSHKRTHSHSSMVIDDHISEEEDEYFEDALAEQQKSPESNTAQPRQFEKLPEPIKAAPSTINDTDNAFNIGGSGIANPPKAMAQPPPVLSGASSSLRKSPSFARDDQIQVPTTQNSRNTLKRSLSDRGSVTHVVSKKSKLSLAKLAANLMRESDSPPRDTREMARMSRRSFKSGFAVSGAYEAETLSSSPVSNNIIPGTRPNVNGVALISNRDKATLTEYIPESSGASLHRSAITNENGIESAPKGKAVADPKALEIVEDLHKSRSPEQESSPLTPKAVPISSSTHALAVGQLEDPFYTGPPPNRGGHHEDASEYAEREYSYFDKYQFLYPDFDGSQKRFTEALVYIEWLRKGNYPIHQSLYDDFVRVYASEYIPWAREQVANKLPPIPGWEYYDKNIARPVYQQGIITTRNLQDALASLDTKQVEMVRGVFSKNAKKSQKIAVEAPVSSPAPTKESPARINTPRTAENHDPIVDSGSKSRMPISEPKSQTNVAVEPQAPTVRKATSKESLLSNTTPPGLLRRSQAGSSGTLKNPKATQRTRESSVDIGRSATRDRPSSPEVEVVSVVKQNPPKKPFFETPSQLPRDVRAEQKMRHSEASVPSSSPPATGSTPKPKARRSPSWPTEKFPSSGAISTPHVGSITQLKISSRQVSRGEASSPPAESSTSKKRPRAASPILGSEEEDLLPARKQPKLNPAANLPTSSHRQRESFSLTPSPPPKHSKALPTTKSTTSSNHQRDNVEATSSPSSRISSAHVAALPKADDKVKVSTWLTEQQDAKQSPKQEVTKKKKPRSFTEFLAKTTYIPRSKRKSLGGQSMVPAPNSMLGNAGAKGGRDGNLGMQEPETQVFAFD
jgi:hypothetical protein